MPELINLLILVTIVVILVFAIFWIADQVPLPPPINLAIKVLAGLIGIIILLYRLVPMATP